MLRAKARRKTDAERSIAEPAEIAAPARAEPRPESRTSLILDLTDLIWFLKDHAHLTGIQRVQVGIAFNLLASEIDLSRIGASRQRLVFACFDSGRGQMVAVSPEGLVTLVEDIHSKSLERVQIDKRLNLLMDAATAVQPKAGDIFVILGAYWFGPAYFQALRLVKGRGCRFGVFIHDLIPLTHPAFVHAGTREAMIGQVADILILSDFVLTNSDYVAAAVRDVLRVELQVEKPVFSVPLSHELPELGPRREGGLDQALPNDYVLCVGTIEGRKNHILLLRVWEALYRKHGDALPPLVIVGKWGWHVDEFKRQLETGGYVRGRIIVLEGVSDHDLRDLYEKCLFTVFPSFAEGWGLPVGESLACGKPCITSNAASLPEVGGDFCRYIDPFDLADCTDKIEKAVFDRDDLNRWTKRVQDDFAVRKWSDVAESFVDRMTLIVGALAESQVSAEAARLSPGRIYRIASGPPADASWSDRSVKFAPASGWFPLEAWGGWSSQSAASVSFEAVGAAPGSIVTVWMQLRMPPPPSDDLVMISDELAHGSQFRLPRAIARWTAVDTTVGSGGRVSLKLRRLGAAPDPIGGRVMYLGISAIGFHPKRDVDTRINLMESIVVLDGPRLVH